MGDGSTLRNSAEDAIRMAREEIDACTHLVEEAIASMWGRRSYKKEKADDVPSVTSENGRVKAVDFGKSRGRMDYDYDGEGLKSVTRNGRSLLERLTVPNSAGESSWRVQGGEAFRGVAQIAGDGTLSFRGLTGDTYHFKPDGSREILYAGGVREIFLVEGLRKVIDPQGITATFDASNRPVKIDYKNGKSLSFSYDDKSGIKEFVDLDGTRWQKTQAGKHGFEEYTDSTGAKKQFAIVPVERGVLSVVDWDGSRRIIDRAGYERTDRVEPHRDLEDLATWVSVNLQRIDSDRSGALSVRELRKAAEDRQFTGVDSQMLTALIYSRKHLTALDGADGNREEISVADVQALVKLHKEKPDNQVAAMLNKEMALVRERLSGIDRRLYGDKTNPLEAIKPEAIKQGSIGDCWLLATIAALAQSDPKSIASMIKENSDGTFTVTFPGDKEHPRTVPAPSDTELALFAAGSRNGIWVAVLEKAMAKHFADGRLFAVEHEIDVLNGGHLATALRLLTGQRAVELGTGEPNLEAKFMVAAQWGTPIVAGSNTDHSGAIEKPDERGIWSQHAYSVSYDPATRMVTVRNPWGKGIGHEHPSEPMNPGGTARDGKLDGVFRLSVSDFRKSFSLVAVVTY